MRFWINRAAMRYRAFPCSVLDRVNNTHRSVGAASVNLAAGSSLVDGVIHDDDPFFTQILVALWEGYIPQTYFNGVWSTPGLPASVFSPGKPCFRPLSPAIFPDCEQIAGNFFLVVNSLV